MPEAYDLVEQGKIQTLTDLNRFFAAWLEVAYHQKVHNSFKQRPADRYEKCDHPLRKLPPHELKEVFLLEETRKVDKTGCISLFGTIYEVESSLAGETIQVRFDSYDLSEVQVWKDENRHKDGRVMELRNLKREKRGKDAEPKTDPILTSTGLNYVELVYDTYMDEQKKRHQHGFQHLVNAHDSFLLRMGKHAVYKKDPYIRVISFRTVSEMCGTHALYGSDSCFWMYYRGDRCREVHGYSLTSFPSRFDEIPVFLCG